MAEIQKEIKQRNLNKIWYSIYLIILRYIPISLAICEFLHVLFSWFGINLQILAYIGGISIIPLIFMLLASILFRYCITHRLPLYYCLMDSSISVIDYYYSLPLIETYYIYFIIFGISVILYVYCYVKFGLKCK